jgi:hypothetical protein
MEEIGREVLAEIRHKLFPGLEGKRRRETCSDALTPEIVEDVIATARVMLRIRGNLIEKSSCVTPSQPLNVSCHD